MNQTDYLIIGAGIAGLSTALHLKDQGKVTVITNGEIRQANTYWAQGGVAAVLTKEDRFVKHINDTLDAGANHNNREAVRSLVENAPKAIRFLESIGMKFNTEPALEGGHSESRVWRTSDFTGQDILDHLIKAVQKAKNINIRDHTDAVDLIVENDKCRGVFVREKGSETLTPFFSKATILATGGLGQLFSKTSNTLGAGGDGVSMAAKVGLELSDLEFVQFHPTALNIPDNGRYFLLSETLRGFGAKIINHEGKAFLGEYDRRAELAPRDIVTRAVYFEMENGPVYLDMRHLDGKEVKKRFPNIYKRLKHYGLDLSADLIPITPVAHFSCGGVPTDLKGATRLPGLYAVGETANTKVHGANRLASNALLEGLVFSEFIAKDIHRKNEEGSLVTVDEAFNPEVPKIVVEPLPQVKAYAKRIGQIMWERVGIVRSPEGLKLALKEIAEIPARDYRIQNRQIVCYKLIQACLHRPLSLGCHYIASDLSHL